MSAGRDRPYCLGKHKCFGVNVPVIAYPAGRLIWASPALPGARHDMGAAHDYGILAALHDAGVHVLADSGYQGAGRTVAVPQRRRRLDPDTGRCRRLSRNRKQVNEGTDGDDHSPRRVTQPGHAELTTSSVPEPRPTV